MSVTLWLVEIDESDWDYDRFESAVVWAATAADAEQIIRSARRYPDARPDASAWERKLLWIEDPEWKLNVTPAPTEGVAHTHWHAG